MKKPKLLESPWALRNALGVHLESLKALDVLPKERRRTQKFRLHLLDAANGICGACLSEFGNSELQAAHIIPLQLGASTSMENLILLCLECHGYFDKGRMSISNMFRLKAEVDSGRRSIPAGLEQVDVPALSTTITPPPAKIQSAMKEVQESQRNTGIAEAIKLAKSELIEHAAESSERKWLLIKIAELLRRQGAEGALAKSIKILESLDVETLPSRFLPRYFYELIYVYKLSGRKKDVLAVEKQSSESASASKIVGRFGVDYVAERVSKLALELAWLDKLSPKECQRIVAEFTELVDIATGHGGYWGGRWAMNSSAQIVVANIKAEDEGGSWDSLEELRNRFYSSDISNGWDLAARSRLSLLDGLVHTMFPRKDHDLNRGIQVLVRPFLSKLGTRLRPEGIRDVGYGLSRGLLSLDPQKYRELAGVLESIMNRTVDGTSYIWPYLVDSD